MQKQMKGHSRCNDSSRMKVKYSDGGVYRHRKHAPGFKNVDPILINFVKEINKNGDLCI